MFLAGPVLICSKKRLVGERVFMLRNVQYPSQPWGAFPAETPLLQSGFPDTDGDESSCSRDLSALLNQTGIYVEWGARGSILRHS